MQTKSEGKKKPTGTKLEPINKNKENSKSNKKI